MSASWTKLKSGAWGVKTAMPVIAGQKLTVTKQSGETQTVTIEKIVWSDTTTAICAVKSEESASRKSSGPTKRCWECGCQFTYGDAKANGGDWQDSYCGC